jgi:hypothetical protein
MKKIVTTLTLLALSSAYADSSFVGLNVKIGTGYQSSNVDSVTFTGNQDGTDFPVPAPSQRKTSLPLMLGLGYNQAINDKFILGVGLDYQTLQSTAGTDTFAVTGSQPGVQYKFSNQYSVYLTPSLVLDKDSIAYLKVGYASQTLTGNYVPYGAGDTTSGSFGKSTVNGYLIGLGYKQIISNNVFGYLETNYYKYNSASLNNTINNATVSGNNPTSNSYNLILGVGYNF